MDMLDIALPGANWGPPMWTAQATLTSLSQIREAETLLHRVIQYCHIVKIRIPTLRTNCGVACPFCSLYLYHTAHLMIIGVHRDCRQTNSPPLTGITTVTVPPMT